MFDIIVPAYRVHETLEDTLTSLALQRLSYLLNVYIIDDQDGESYQDIYTKFLNLKKFNGIYLFENDKNRGVGYAKARGVEESKKNSNSPWILFLDGDDCLYSPYAINIFLSLIEQNPNAKVVLTKIASEKYPLNIYPFLQQEHGGSYGVDFNPATIFTYLHGKVFNRAYMEETGLKIPHTRSNEDLAFTIPFFSTLKEEEMVISNEITFITTFNPNSITRGEQSTRKGLGDNPLEMYDAYIGRMENFDTFIKHIQKQGKVFNYRNGRFFFADFYWRYKAMLVGKHKNEQSRLFIQMTLYLYYRDILLPALKNTSRIFYPTIMDQNDSALDFWGPKDRYFDIEKVGKELKASFNQDKFDELKEQFILDKTFYD